MKRVLDFTGLNNGKLTAVEKHSVDKQGRSLWLFRCECGGSTVTLPYNVKSGNTQSCGCLPANKTRQNDNWTYLEQATYRAWTEMHDRCRNSNRRDWDNYGGRGIKVCLRWNTFQSFKLDMSIKPSPELSLDRIDNNGNYEPTNCRWATKSEQRQNQRTSTEINSTLLV